MYPATERREKWLFFSVAEAIFTGVLGAEAPDKHNLPS